MTDLSPPRSAHAGTPQPLPEVCVVYLVRVRDGGEEVLLGRKRTGLGVGKIVAPGGKLQPGEQARDAAVREVAEEVGLNLRVDDLVLVGEIDYPFEVRTDWSQKSWVFLSRGDFGEPSLSSELDARWIPIGDIPIDEMWDDAQYWLLDALAGVHVRATFCFGSDSSTVSWSDHPKFVERQSLAHRKVGGHGTSG